MIVELQGGGMDQLTVVQPQSTLLPWQELEEARTSIQLRVVRALLSRCGGRLQIDCDAYQEMLGTGQRSLATRESRQEILADAHTPQPWWNEEIGRVPDGDARFQSATAR